MAGSNEKMAAPQSTSTQSEATLKEAMSSYLVFLKGALMRRTVHILAATAEGMGLFDPYTGKPSQFWRFSEEGVSLLPGVDDEEVVISVSRGKASRVQRMMGMGTEAETKWSFTSLERSRLLTEFLFLRDASLGELVEPDVYMGCFSSSGGGAPQKKVQILAGGFALRVSLPDGEAIVELPYHQIRRIRRLGDLPGGFAVKHFGEWHIFSCDDRDALMQLLVDSSQRLGIVFDFGCSIALTEIENEMASVERLRLEAVQQWQVLRQPPPKTSVSTTAFRNAAAESRTLFLTPTHILECETGGSCRVLVARPLSSLSVILRSSQEPQRLALLYNDKYVAWYDSFSRDSLIVTLADAVKSLSPLGLAVYSPEGASERLAPMLMSADRASQIEAIFAKRLAALSESGVLPGADDWDVVNPLVVHAAADMLAHCSPGSGGSKDVEGAMQAVARQLKGRRALDLGEDDGEIVTLLRAFGQLVGSKAGYARIMSAVKKGSEGGGDIAAGLKSVRVGLMSRSSDIVTASVQVVRALLASEGAGGGGGVRDALLDGEALEALAGGVKRHCGEGGGGGAMCLCAVLELFCDLVCPSQEGPAAVKAVPPTVGKSEECVVRLLADNVMMTSLLGHVCRPVAALASKLLTVIINGSNSEFVEAMQGAAMREGTLLRHLHAAMFVVDKDQRALSRFLCAIWIDGSDSAVALLQRLLPPGTLDLFAAPSPIPEEGVPHFLQSGQPAPRPAAQGQQFGASVLLNKDEQEEQQRSRRRDAWVNFFELLDKDWIGVCLLWDATRRSELRAALEAEMQSLARHRATISSPNSAGACFSWNHEEFEVTYPSLGQHLCVDGVYLKAALSAGEGVIERVPDPCLFFTKLYRLSLEATNEGDTVVYLKAMAMVLGGGRTHVIMAALGGVGFYGISHLIRVLDKAQSVALRDTSLLLVECLVSYPPNAVEFVKGGGAGLLVKIAASIHAERFGGDAISTTENLLEAGADSYDNDGSKYRVWRCRSHPSQGMLLNELQAAAAARPEEQWRLEGSAEDDWSNLADIEQLRWTVAMKASAGGGMSRVQLCLRCISMLKALCRLFPSRDELGMPKVPVPRIKRALTAPSVLPHIVQLSLAGHIVVVEEGMDLLSHVLDCGEAGAARRLYQTGFFFFSLCYAGDDLGAVARVLRDTHMTQDWYRRDQDKEDTSSPSCSILSQLLPPSLVCFLSNHPPEAFSGVFRGDSDTPEAIWNGRMRCHLAACLRQHVSTFAYTLRENFLHVYEYTPMITPVRYAELDQELWCHSFFLRNLCNQGKYPDWTIRDPFSLLKATIAFLRREEARRDAPPSLTKEQACAELGITVETKMAEAKKAYRKLVLMLHPDKNPDGRARFEKVQAAFEVLQKAEDGAEEILAGDGGGKQAMTLLLRTQEILYRRHGQALAKYRYPCYPLLCSLITTNLIKGGDTDGSSTCSVIETMALTAAAASGNAEELADSGGLEVLRALLKRCLAVVGGGDLPRHDPWVRSLSACLHALACVLGAGQDTRMVQGKDAEDIVQMIKDIVSCLSSGASRVVEASLFCCMAACDNGLVTQLCDQGGLWGLVEVACAGGGVKGEVLVSNPAHGGQRREEVADGEAGTSELNLLPPRVLQSGGGSGEGRRLSTLAILALSRVVQRAQGELASGVSWSMGLLLTTPLYGLLTEVLVVEGSERCGVLARADHVRELICGSVRSVRCVWTEGMRSRALAQCRAKGGKGVEAMSGFLHDELRSELWVGGVFVRPLLDGGAADLTAEERETVCYALLAYLNRVAGKDENWRLGCMSDDGGGGVAGIWQGLSTPELTSGWLLGRVSDDYVDAPPPGGVRGGSKQDTLLALQAVVCLVEADMNVGSIDCLNEDQYKCALQSLAALPLISRLISLSEGDASKSPPLNLLKVLCERHASLAARVVGEPGSGLVGRLFGAAAARGFASGLIVESIARICAVSSDVVGEMRRGGCIAAILVMMAGGWPEGTDNLRVSAANLLQSCLRDALHGSAVLQDVKRVLPVALAWKVAAEGAAILELLEEDSITPELVWAEPSRRLFSESMKNAASRMCRGGGSGSVGFLEGGGWCGGEPPEIAYADEETGGFVVGGVFVELFIKDPGFPLKDPEHFLDELVRCFVSTSLQLPTGGAVASASIRGWESSGIEKQRLIEGVVSALLSLLRVHPALCSLIGSAGHIKGFCQVLNEAAVGKDENDELDVNKKCLQLIRQALTAPDNSQHAAAAGLVKSLLTHIRRQPASTLTLALEAFDACAALSGSLRRQAVDLGCVSDLLGILGAGVSLAHCVDASAARVHAIDTLKALSADEDKGGAVKVMLEASEAWKGCEGQHHDLFLSSSAAPLLLAGPGGGGGGTSRDTYSGL